MTKKEAFEEFWNVMDEASELNDQKNDVAEKDRAYNWFQMGWTQCDQNRTLDNFCETCGCTYLDRKTEYPRVEKYCPKCDIDQLRSDTYPYKVTGL